MSNDDRTTPAGRTDVDGADRAEFRHTDVTIGDSTVHVVESGDPTGRPVLFLHGWPQSWESWAPLMSAAGPDVRAIAIDLPGIGRSTGDATDGSKRAIASVVHGLVEQLALRDPTLVGHDAGGMVAYSYLRTSGDLGCAVIMDTVIPGVDPWRQVLANPYVWHFAMHAIPELPETLVRGRQREYFDYFFDVLSPDPSRITPTMRAAAVEAYREGSALTAGFNWYRTLPADAAANEADRAPVDLPVLYLRGAQEGSRMQDYLDGFRRAGLANVKSGLIPGAGHFAQLEQPDAVWRAIADFRDPRRGEPRR